MIFSRSLAAAAVIALTIPSCLPRDAWADDASFDKERFQLLEKELAALKKEVEILRQTRRPGDAMASRESGGVRHRETGNKLAVAPATTNGAVAPSQEASEQASIRSAAAVSPAATNSYAAAFPVKAPPPVVAGGFYFSADSFYEKVRLPAYSLGFRNILTCCGGQITGDRPEQTFNPTLNGGGAQVAAGYIFPGSTTKVEFGASYIGAKGASTQVTTLASPTTLMTSIPLDGTIPPLFIICDPGAGRFCTTTGTLNSSYQAWRVNGKVATDWKFGSVVLTPSAALFGGTSRSSQTFSQKFFEPNFAPTGPGSYDATSALRWTDFGARFGLDGTVQATEAISLGIKGWIGGARRATSLSANDRVSFVDPLPAQFFNHAAAISGSDDKFVFLANVEAGVGYRFAPMATLRAFAGLNFDNSVPGINRAGIVFANPIVNVPANIYYASEVNYYAGAGMTVTFGGPVVAKY